MKLILRTILVLLSVSLVGACDVFRKQPAGDFCEVVSGTYQFQEATAQAMVRTDRAQVVRLDAQNQYWSSKCK